MNNCIVRAIYVDSKKIYLYNPNVPPKSESKIKAKNRASKKYSNIHNPPISKRIDIHHGNMKTDIQVNTS
jgi:predicted adenine nucleotide alpha hydrolase (AANH) superfamily ATPase